MSVFYKFGKITLLKCMSALGILASSFYISSAYGISEFGEFSFVMAISGLVLVISRMGAEYTCFKFFLREYMYDKSKAFNTLQVVVVNSVVISSLLLLLVISLIEIPEKLVCILIMHTLTFSIIQPLSFAFRSIEKFTLAYSFEAGTFLLIITFFWLLSKVLFGISYTHSSIFFYSLYLMLFIYKTKSIFNFRAIHFRKQISTVFNSISFLSYTLAEYACFWGPLLVSGFLLTEAETGTVSWGTRVFQMFVFVVSIRNSIEVPRILKGNDVRQSLGRSIVENTKSTVMLIIPLVVVLLTYFLDFFETNQGGAVVMFIFFYMAAVVRYFFGPICHIFTSISEKTAIFSNFLVVMLTSIIGFILIFYYGYSAVGPAYLLTWCGTLFFSYYVIFKLRPINDTSD